MTYLYVNTPTKELVVAWGHPWRKLGLRGFKDAMVKVTQCMIGEVIDKDNHKFKFGGIYQVKWPIYSIHTGPDFKAFSKTTLPNEVLSKDRGRRYTLKEAIKALTKSNFINKHDALLIWEAYFRQWPLNPSPTPTPSAVVPAKVEVVDGTIIRPRLLIPEKTTVRTSPEGHRVVSKIIKFPTRTHDVVLAPVKYLVH